MKIILDYHILFSMLIGFCIDLVVGDPRWMPHPVRGMGRCIQLLEKGLRRETDGHKKQVTKGILLWILLVLLWVGVSIALLWGFYRLHPLAGLTVESILCAFCLAAKDLKVESEYVERELERGGIQAGRLAVGRIVGRDTERLSEAEVRQAAVETVAENASDGEIAPLFYICLFGGVGGIFYKTVNTMDSMLGYRNEKYEYFGKVAALMDDVFNYVPARISGVMISLAAYMLPFSNGKEAFRIWKRDRRNHKSPNSAQSESAMAGALGLLLGGTHTYFGKEVVKPTIGDKRREIEKGDIEKSNALMYMASGLTLMVFVSIRLLLQVIMA